MRVDLFWALQWRHNGRGSVSNHQPLDCFPNRLFRRKSKKTSKLRVTGLCAENSPGTGEFPAQRGSDAENVSIWWRHHEADIYWFYRSPLESGIEQVAEILPRRKPETVNPTKSMPWLLMTWFLVLPVHQLPLCWLHSRNKSASVPNGLMYMSIDSAYEFILNWSNWLRWL